jgi:hypothetical protein
MGNSSSSNSAITSEQDNTVINQSTINSVNELYNKAVVNMTVQTVQKCSSSLIQSQNITLSNLKIAGNITFDIQQWQDALVDFSCVQKEAVKQDVVNQMTSQIMQDLQSSTSTDVFSKLNDQAAAASKTDFGSFPWAQSSSNSDVNQKIKNYISNQTTVNLQNVVSTSVYSNFTNLTESTCFAQIVQNQNITVQGVQGGGDLSFSANQKQSASMFAKCVQDMNVSNKIVNDVTTFLGIKVKNDTQTTAESEATASSTAESTTLGPLGSLADALSQLIPNFGLDISMLLPVCASLSLCCCCIILILFAVMIIR